MSSDGNLSDPFWNYDQNDNENELFNRDKEKKKKKNDPRKNVINLKPYFKELEEIEEDVILDKTFKDNKENWKALLRQCREERMAAKNRGKKPEESGDKATSHSKQIKKKPHNTTGVNNMKYLPNYKQPKKFESKPPRNYRDILKIKKRYLQHPIEDDIVPRNDWDLNAKEKNDKETQQMIYYERVHHITYKDTGSLRMCLDEDECSEEMEKLLFWNEEKKESDIDYNFLIGGDGRIYEGRGWPVMKFNTAHHFDELPGEIDENINEKEQNKKLTIGFIGKFRDRRLPPKMFWAAYEFVNYGMRMRRISKGFTYTPLKIGEERGAWDHLKTIPTK